MLSLNPQVWTQVLSTISESGRNTKSSAKNSHGAAAKPSLERQGEAQPPRINIGVPATDGILNEWHARLQRNVKDTNLFWKGRRVVLFERDKSGRWMIAYAGEHARSDDFAEVAASELRVVSDRQAARLDRMLRQQAGATLRASRSF